MSNYLAIATVTAALSQMIRPAIQAAVTGADVSTRRPDDPTGNDVAPRVNLFLFHVEPNHEWRNAELPTRRPNGTPIRRPQLALDLHYLLSFYGDETALEPQRLLGRTVSLLHGQPVLTREHINSLIASAQDPTNSYHFLLTSDLAQQVEQVRLAPEPVSLEELSNLWSVFAGTPYHLSVNYKAAAVLIEAETRPRPSLPVRAYNVYADPMQQPVLEAITVNGDPRAPITTASTITLDGTALAGDVTHVQFGGGEFEPTTVSKRQITLDLSTVPANQLRAGVQGIRVVHERMIGTPPAPHRGTASNLLAFVLRPTITSVTVSNLNGGGDAPRSADLEIQVNPPVGQTQRVLILLNEFDPPDTRPAHAYQFELPPRNQPGDPAFTTTITAAVSGITAGDYVVRIQVDGADSLPAVETDETAPAFNQFTEPQVALA